MKDDNGWEQAPNTFAHTGTSYREVVFFWASTSTGSSGPATETVTVNLIYGGPLSATTTFLVYTPTSTASIIQGAPGIVWWAATPTQPAHWEVGMEPTATAPRGVTWTASVTQPSGFTAGTFDFVQKINPWRYIKYQSPWHADEKARFQGYWVLDNTDPYTAGWTTGTTGSTGESG